MEGKEAGEGIQERLWVDGGERTDEREGRKQDGERERGEGFGKRQRRKDSGGKGFWVNGEEKRVARRRGEKASGKDSRTERD